jgi:general secretion pathway protein I
LRSSADPKSERNGFTLLEVMVALAVVAIAFVALLGLNGRDIAVAARIDNFSRATLLAREMMTQMQFEDYNSLGDGNGKFDWYPQFRWVRSVTPTNMDTVKEVRLQIIWDENHPHACEVIYFIRDPNA